TRNLRLHMATLEDIPLRALSSPVIREWHAATMRGKGGRASIPQSYRFLHAVLATAVRDSAIPVNPANIPGAGTDRAKERPVALASRTGPAVGRGSTRHHPPWRVAGFRHP